MSANDDARRGGDLDGREGELLGGDSETSVTDRPPADGIPAQLRRRRAAALRLPPLPCGHRDPLDCQVRDAHARR